MMETGEFMPMRHVHYLIELFDEYRGEAVFGVDTEIISVSRAIEQVTKNAEITDLEVMGSTAEELVVSLYRDFGI